MSTPSSGAVAWVRPPSGQVIALRHGDLVGRLPGAALFLDDPRVSEGHALCVLRSGKLWLLSLRRLLAVRGQPVSEVRLAEGLDVDLAEGVRLHVTRVVAPLRVLALASPGLPVQPVGQVVSLFDEEAPRARYVAGAPAHVWTLGELCFVREGESAPRALAEGERFRVGAREWSLTSVPTAQASLPPTRADGDAAALRLVTHYDSVVVLRTDRPALTMGGIGARIVSEVGACRGPVSWETVARSIWRDDVDAAELRHRWDVALTRLRGRLREAGIRDDLLQADRAGRLSLVLRASDVFEDRG